MVPFKSFQRRGCALGIVAVLFGLALAGCAANRPADAAGSVTSNISVERWWPHFGDAAALERRIVLRP